MSPYDGCMVSVQIDDGVMKKLRARAEVEGISVPELIAQLVDVVDEGVDLDLTPEQEANLMESIDQADRGDVVPMEQVMAELRALRR